MRFLAILVLISNFGPEGAHFDATKIIAFKIKKHRQKKRTLAQDSALDYLQEQYQVHRTVRTVSSHQRQRISSSAVLFAHAEKGGINF